MNSAIRKLKIHTIRAQVALCELTCEALAKQFAVESLTHLERSEVAHRMDAMSSEKDALQHALELLEKQQREEID